MGVTITNPLFCIKDGTKFIHVPQTDPPMTDFKGVLVSGFNVIAPTIMKDFSIQINTHGLEIKRNDIVITDEFVFIGDAQPSYLPPNFTIRPMNSTELSIRTIDDFRCYLTRSNDFNSVSRICLYFTYDDVRMLRSYLHDVFKWTYNDRIIYNKEWTDNHWFMSADLTMCAALKRLFLVKLYFVPSLNSVQSDTYVVLMSRFHPEGSFDQLTHVLRSNIPKVFSKLTIRYNDAIMPYLLNFLISSRSTIPQNVKDRLGDISGVATLYEYKREALDAPTELDEIRTQLSVVNENYKDQANALDELNKQFTSVSDGLSDINDNITNLTNRVGDLEKSRTTNPSSVNQGKLSDLEKSVIRFVNDGRAYLISNDVNRSFNEIATPLPSQVERLAVRYLYCLNGRFFNTFNNTLTGKLKCRPVRYGVTDYMLIHGFVPPESGYLHSIINDSDYRSLLRKNELSNAISIVPLITGGAYIVVHVAHQDVDSLRNRILAENSILFYVHESGPLL